MFGRNLTLGQYVDTGSVIHKLDPRAKLLSVIVIITELFPAKNYAQLMMWSVILYVVVRMSRLKLREIMRSARAVMILAVMTFIFNMAGVYAGTGWEEALYRAILGMMKLILVMMYGVMLPLTTSPMELTDGLDVMMRPLERVGFPSQEFALMMGMALRFIPLLGRETDKIIRAQLSRGAALDQGNIFQRVRAFFPVLIPLFIMIFRSAEETAFAMEARGYDGGRGRTRRQPLKWSRSDTVAVIISVIMSVIIYNVL